MKIKTLLLSTVTAAGFSSAAMAADPAAVLTSLDVCDALGISGLTISSDSNCLQISGGVEYLFEWGDYAGTAPGTWLHAPSDNDFWGIASHNHNQDWTSKVDAWLKFVGTADSDFGPAKAVIKLKFDEDVTVVNEGSAHTPPVPTVTSTLTVSEAYAAVGNSTVLMAGKKGSIASLGHDKAYNYLGLRHDDFGIATSTGGHVIQLTSDLGNGVDVGIGLENLNGLGALIGVLNYSGDTLAAHITFGADDILTGTISQWSLHAGAEVTLDMFKILAAVNYESVALPTWDAMASIQAMFDMFKVAASIYGNSANGLEIAGSVSADVTDTVSIALGGQWDDHDTTVASNEQWKAAAQLKAKVTETVTVTAEVGVDGEVATPTTVAYGAVEAAWAPGGGFTSSVKFEGNAVGAYKGTFKAAKSFK